MVHIVIIRPPSLSPAITFTTTPGVPPLGIAYLGSSLKKAGHTVQLIDSFGEAPDKRTKLPGTDLLISGLTANDIVSRIASQTYIIGVTCTFSNDWYYVKELFREIRIKFPQAVIVVGGEHATSDPAFTLNSAPEIDVLVRGEGEYTLLELVDKIENQLPWQNIKGIVYKDENGQFITNPDRPRIESLDDLPWPAWDDVPLETYLSRGLGHGASGGRNMPIIASRGCPFRCSFCSNPTMWHARWIVRSHELVIKEMEYYLEKFNITHFEFSDLTAVVRKDWILDFCNLLLSKQLNVTWSLPSGTRSEALSEPVLLAMYKSGCSFFSYAPESGSKKTLERIHKKADPDRMLRSMRTAVKIGFDVKANIIVGFPGQTLYEVLETFWYLVKMAFIGVHDVPVFPFAPYQGSELYRQLVSEGKINPQDPNHELWLCYNIYNTPEGMRSWSDHIPNCMMKLLTMGGMVFFYSVQFLFRPWRLAAMLFRVMRNQPKLFIDRILHEILNNFLIGKKRRLKSAK